MIGRCDNSGILCTFVVNETDQNLYGNEKEDMVSADVRDCVAYGNNVVMF